MKLARLIIILFASFTLLVACSDDPQNAVEVPPLPLITTSATVATEAVDTESEAETIADDSAEIESTDPLIVTEVENEHSAELTPGDCPFEEGERNFECGTIRVTETRDPAFADEDNSITLAYAVMKSSSATPAADPLVYLEGGPGGDTMTTVDWFLADYMSVFLAERDVIFFSHRGSAGATPHLDCAPLTDIDYQYLDQPAEANDAYDAAFREAIFGCRDELIAEGANLASYNSAESAADVKDLLTALGYEQASFYGASYGTRLAQTIMRDHPQIVRSAIIDAVVPLDKTFEPSVITSMDRAFEHLFAACTQDSACNAIYPDLRGVFYSTVDLLNETPVLVEGASDRYTGVSRDVMVNGDMLMNGLFGALYADFQLPELPKAIYDAQAGDYELFIDEAFYNIFSGELLFSEIQHLTTVCYEDVAFDTQADFDAAAATVEPRIASFNLDSDSYYSVCADVIDRTAAPLENEAVLSDIPTLILSGAFDPITPPAYGAAVAANLSNSTHLTFSMLSHGSFGDNECPQSIVLAFLDDPSAPIDSSCVADMQPLEFTLPLTSEETSNDETAAQVTEPIVIDDNAGASGLGDSLYPEMGNGGYDVKHYTLDLAVDVVNNELDATVTIKAETIQLLSAFNLDLRGLFVERVTVDGVEVNFGRNGDELTIQPATPLPADTLFTVVIDYNGSPQSFRDPALSFTEIGWTEFNGGIFVFGEPSGAKTWYPSNNHPQDKATFTFNITTDSTYTVAATGRLVEEIENGDETTVTWEMSSPMATYLAAIYIGDFVREESVTDSGILIRNYFPPTLSSAEKADFAQTADVIAYYSDLFGPYPFDVYGSIVVDGELGFALENQTLSIHGRDATDIYTIAHEIMHQWTGNNLSLGDWQDIWLNEGFAFYIPFLYLDATGQTDIDRLMGGLYADLESRASVGSAVVSINDLFNFESVYLRGGMTLYALHELVGDDEFRTIMRTYYESYAGVTATSADFIAIAESVSGAEAVDLLKAWLYSNELPELP